MTESVSANLCRSDQTHFDLHRRDGFADIHCRCLYDSDDGPSTPAESLELCKMLACECIAAGEETAQLVCSENPLRVLQGHDIPPVSVCGRKEVGR